MRTAQGVSLAGLGPLPDDVAAAPGESGYDPLLRDLADYADRATARTAAKFTEYPQPSGLSGGPWPWRPTILLVLAVQVSVFIGLIPTRAHPYVGDLTEAGWTRVDLLS